MRDLNLLNQAWPNAVFGLRPRLFFLLIPYIHIFILHNRRLYERKRPYHLRASDLRGNGTDPGDDSDFIPILISAFFTLSLEQSH